jgi:hypothetical protein
VSLILIFADVAYFRRRGIESRMKSPMMALEHNKELQKFGRETLKCQGAALGGKAPLSFAISLARGNMMTYVNPASSISISHMTFSQFFLSEIGEHRWECIMNEVVRSTAREQKSE